jgi:hypothetical protein
MHSNVPLENNIHQAKPFVGDSILQLIVIKE